MYYALSQENKSQAAEIVIAGGGKTVHAVSLLEICQELSAVWVQKVDL